MTYQVLARKWRPRTFDQLVGQEHVVRALVNALDNDRLHHAFLFTGTRGVGKTTLARILAKSLNCEKGVSSHPCGQCAACREVDEGRFVDLIEVDAASRTKVEDTRELMDNVQYAPTRGRYKVYLIDEVHMLSAHSFNALLKTLEEPPPHVKFLLATTDPQKVPVTVLSRCLQFSLKRLPAEQISGYIAKLLDTEGITFEPAGLERIARAADGSMRDALSLLDQAIAYGGGRVIDDEVRAMLGTIEQDHVLTLLRGIIAGDAQVTLETVVDLSSAAPDFGGVLAEMLSTLQRIALAQVLPEAVDDSLGDRAALLELAGEATPEDIQLYYQIALIGRRDLALAPDPRGGFEMVLLRMLAFSPAAPSQSMPKKVAPQGQAGATRATGGSVAKPVKAVDPTPPLGTSAESAAQPRGDDWHAIVNSLRLGGMARELAMHCSLAGRAGNTLRLLLDGARGQLRTASLETRLAEALAAHFGEPVRLQISIGEPTGETPAARLERDQAQRQAAAEAAVADDPNVQALQEFFSAEIRQGSIKPLD